MADKEMPLTREARELRRVQARYDRAKNRTEAIRRELHDVRTARDAAFVEDLLNNPETPHTEMADRWGVAESTVRGHRILLGNRVQEEW